MQNITLLDQNTINKIAAGEVVERPSAVVKELVENSIDAKANGITVEIKEGGISFIRITDNGSGMEKNDIALAFQRHSTSKIKTAEDLLQVSSLGFRGEALSSIASVSQIELVTKTSKELTGIRYRIEGGIEKGSEEIGCPEGTTFMMRNLFYNTPARRKFLKSETTEAGYIHELMERLAISHPYISFKFIHNNQLKLHTTGNGNLKDIIFHIYGKEVAKELLTLSVEQDKMNLTGFIGKPDISRGNRNYMNYFINGRYIKSPIIQKAIEEAYKPYIMLHRYPFSVLHFEIESKWIDVNVHPSKMEIRFRNSEEIYEITYQAISQVLKGKELIPDVTLRNEKEKKQKKDIIPVSIPEPFETKRQELYKKNGNPSLLKESDNKLVSFSSQENQTPYKENTKQISEKQVYPKSEQISLVDVKLLSEDSMKKLRIIGQLFSTYWLVEYEDKLYLMDQHAAHEKVLFEQTMELLKRNQLFSQVIEPPIILSLNLKEEAAVKSNLDIFHKLGFEIESFGGQEYSIHSVPSNLLGLQEKDILIEMIDSFSEDGSKYHSTALLEKAASIACKAAVKGKQSFSNKEAEELIRSLLKLENPYHCPHGRPTFISMSKYEIEKKFKRT